MHCLRSPTRCRGPVLSLIHICFAEQILFPEIDIDKITKIFGMEITFVTSAKSAEEAYALLREFGLPFKNAKKN